MKEELSSELGEKRMTLETLDGITILNLGEEISLVDIGFLWSAMYGTERKPPEWKLLFNPDQLIIDFSQVEFVEQIGDEFSTLDKEYKKVKGKGIIFCGLKGRIEEVIKLVSGEEYSKMNIIGTREEALQYFCSNQRQRNQNNNVQQ